MGIGKSPGGDRRGKGHLWLLVVFLILITASVTYSVITAIPLLIAHQFPHTGSHPADNMREDSSLVTQEKQSFFAPAATARSFINNVYPGKAHSSAAKNSRKNPWLSNTS